MSYLKHPVPPQSQSPPCEVVQTIDQIVYLSFEVWDIRAIGLARISRTFSIINLFCPSEAFIIGIAPTYIGLYSRNPPDLTAACKLMSHLESGEFNIANRDKSSVGIIFAGALT